MWREDPIVISENMLNGKLWPKVSIVTPSYNQGKYIEETIRSVIMQGYPNLEFIIIDGGSTDNSVEIIKKYEKHITYWVSEKDKGQTHAINKGFEKATGDILAYLNSDDVYMPYTLRLVAELFDRYNVNWLTGLRSHLVDNVVISPLPAATTKFNSKLYKKGFHVPWVLGWNQQPSTFWSASLFNKAGRLFDESMQCSFDVDMWIRFSSFSELVYVRAVLAMMRQHSEQKSRTLRLDFAEIEGQAGTKYQFYSLWFRKLLMKSFRFPVLRKIARIYLGHPRFTRIDWDPVANDWKMIIKPFF
ncbi:MAG: glycosyltransferase [Cytophagales bacterium]|nr:glycosyltransferase [Cytophagales bacterium]